MELNSVAGLYSGFYGLIYGWLSLSRTRKGPENLFERERVRDRERKIGYSLQKGTESLVRDRERGSRLRESTVYYNIS